MTDLLAARSQMAMSLAFHMVFATAGIGLPLLMVIAEAQWLRTRQPMWLELAKRNFTGMWRDWLSLSVNVALPIGLLLVLQALESVDEFFAPTSLAPGEARKLGGQ